MATANPDHVLTRQVMNMTAYLGEVRGKQLKGEFRKLVRLMTEEDQLWEWEWFGGPDRPRSYAMGWCILRDGKEIMSICHSTS
ncbi:hypothetical protein ACQ859_15305 [Roseateles chitinivorans]|uniref:hypothetical protein n=1 Tax=Roseateles chitinivorans TaxID=2917965 RepID=UPI003D67CDA7